MQNNILWNAVKLSQENFTLAFGGISASGTGSRKQQFKRGYSPPPTPICTAFPTREAAACWAFGGVAEPGSTPVQDWGGGGDGSSCSAEGLKGSRKWLPRGGSAVGFALVLTPAAEHAAERGRPAGLLHRARRLQVHQVIVRLAHARLLALVTAPEEELGALLKEAAWSGGGQKTGNMNGDASGHQDNEEREIIKLWARTTFKWQRFEDSRSSGSICVRWRLWIIDGDQMWFGWDRLEFSTPTTSSSSGEEQLTHTSCPQWGWEKKWTHVRIQISV